MGNCCFTDSSEDTNPFSREPFDWSVTDQRRIRTRPVPAGRTRTSTELFRPTSNPMSPSGQHMEDEVKRAQRQGIISQIPTGIYDAHAKKYAECAICMIDFETGDEIKYLPCMHIYHKECVDDWLVRSLRCPACMEPVDAALLSTFGSVGSY